MLDVMRSSSSSVSRFAKWSSVAAAMVASSFASHALWAEPVAAQGAQCSPGQTYSSAFGKCVEECWVDEGYDLETGTCVPLIPSEPAPLSVSTPEPVPPTIVAPPLDANVIAAVETERLDVTEDLEEPKDPKDTDAPAAIVPMPFVWPQEGIPPVELKPEAPSVPTPMPVAPPPVAPPSETRVPAPAPIVPTGADSLELADDVGVDALNPNHPCVETGLVPDGVTSNSELVDYAYLPGTNECVTLAEFNERLDSFEEAAEAERSALEELRDATDAMGELKDDFEQVEARLVEARRAYRDAYEEATEASTLVKETRKKLLDTNQRLAKEREIFAEQAVDSYMGGGDQEMIASLMPSVGAENALGATLSYAEMVLGDRDATIARMEALQVELEMQQREYEERKAQAEVQLDVAHATKVALERTLADRQVLIDAMDVEIASADALVAEFRNDKFESAHDLGVFAVESKKVEEILAEAQAQIRVGEPIAEPTPEPPHYLAPVDPPTYGSPFGPRLHPILGVTRNHDGLDFRADQGQSIFATHGGTVVHADVMGGYGNTVLIDHGDGTASLYAHQSSMAVSYGQTVDQGQVIGYVGSTGMSTGPHLHFEIRVGGVPVDPFPYLEL